MKKEKEKDLTPTEWIAVFLITFLFLFGLFKLYDFYIWYYNNYDDDKKICELRNDIDKLNMRVRGLQANTSTGEITAHFRYTQDICEK